MLGRLLKLSVITTLALSLGVGGTLLQSVAWMGMAWHFAQTSPLKVAIEKTFDGKHPCPLCKLLQKTAPASKRAAVSSPQVKLEALVMSGPVLLCPPRLVGSRWALSRLEPSRAEAPPVPPPRFA